MASMKYFKDIRRWRVFWHVSMLTGEVDRGSKSFRSKKEARRFKVHAENNARRLKQYSAICQILFTEAVDEWRDYIRRFTPRTQNLYNMSMNIFIKSLPDNVVFITDLTENHVHSFLNSLMKAGRKNKTINNYLTIIKSLCNYVEQNHKFPSPAKGIKKLQEDPPKAKFLTKEEYDRVIRDCDDFVRPWIRFLANTGLRASEFAGLRWGNCDFSARTITVIGKGRKQRTIGLNAVALKVLENIKQGRKIRTDMSVFHSKRGCPVTRFTLQEYVSKACRNAGISAGPHAFRHFFATQLLLAGVPIIKVSLLLGHGSITVTQKRYAHILSSDFADATSVLEAL